jgi:ribonuclease P protein component
LFHTNLPLIKKEFTLSKAERLKSRKRIDELFKSGRSFSIPTFRVYYLFEERGAAPLQAGFGVSSRLFRKAVERNRIKRLTRETYRVRKIPLPELLKKSNLSLWVFILYTGRELPEFQHVDIKMDLILQRLTSIINEKAALHP